MSEPVPYETLTKALVVKRTTDAIFGETATTVMLEDEGGGLYVSVSQVPRDGEQKIAMTLEEWPAVRAAIEQMLAVCEVHNGKEAGSI